METNYEIPLPERLPPGANIFSTSRSGVSYDDVKRVPFHRISVLTFDVAQLKSVNHIHDHVQNCATAAKCLPGFDDCLTSNSKGRDSKNAV